MWAGVSTCIYTSLWWEEKVGGPLQARVPQLRFSHPLEDEVKTEESGVIWTERD